jgi:L-lactate dehydrogenase complex protein LldG
MEGSALTMTTRAVFLDRIRQQVAKADGLFEASPAVRPSQPESAAAAIRRRMAERWPEALDRFKEEFERVGGVFHRVKGRAQVPVEIAGIAGAVGATQVVTWDPTLLGFAARGLGAAAPLAVIVAEESHATGDAARREHLGAAARAQIGVTGADLVVAETGTVILLSGSGRPRSTSLLPATHVAVFDASHLVESLEQVGVFLEAWHTDPARSMTGAMINFITGPSRTADIELTLTRGVHGPKDVHAIFVEHP